MVGAVVVISSNVLATSTHALVDELPAGSVVHDDAHATACVHRGDRGYVIAGTVIDGGHVFNLFPRCFH